MTDHDWRWRRPAFAKKKFLDPVRVMEVVEREVTEHRKDRVRVVFAVLRCPHPILGTKFTKPGGETSAIFFS